MDKQTKIIINALRTEEKRLGDTIANIKGEVNYQTNRINEYRIETEQLENEIKIIKDYILKISAMSSLKENINSEDQGKT